jgi:hypothetical protein
VFVKWSIKFLVKVVMFVADIPVFKPVDYFFTGETYH